MRSPRPDRFAVLTPHTLYAQSAQAMKVLQDSLQQQQTAQFQTMLNQQTSQAAGAPSITVSGTHDMKPKIQVKADGNGNGNGGSKFNWPTQNTQQQQQQQRQQQQQQLMQQTAMQQAAQQIQLQQLVSPQARTPSLTLWNDAQLLQHAGAWLPSKRGGRALHVYGLHLQLACRSP